MPIRWLQAVAVALITVTLLGALSLYVSVTVFDTPRDGRLLDVVRSGAGFVLFLLIPCLSLLGIEAVLGLRLTRKRQATRELAHESRTRERLGLPPLLHAQPASPPRPAKLVVAITAVAILAAIAAAVGYAAASTHASSDNGAGRAREVAALAQARAQRATDDGDTADRQLLAYGGDPGLRGADADAALRRLLTGSANVFDALAVIDRDGHVVTSTDPAITDVHASAAFLLARANGRVAGSAAPSPAGSQLRVDFGAPMRAPDGSLGGVLLGRTTAARVWASTLRAAPGGSRNVIVGADGTFIVGVTPDPLGRAWNAAPGASGAIRASVGGVPSICGESAIGSGTPFDMGWRVVSCMPVASATPASRANVVRASVIAAAIVLATALLYLMFWRRRRTPRRRTAPVGFEAIEARLRTPGEGAAR